ncbi:conjugal transfer protein TrbH [Stappia sp. P2PMeth1]|uniref:conjugal transfer protein TrbH n=1 Tax=Stappia sp. P2PMeth1 TaxID=2003586 RepID=UPI00164495E0|nr:conjugal transfer protein TrbH [Stappia sp. P2PMeth1]
MRTFSLFGRLIAAIVLTGLLSACQTLGQAGLIQSTVTAELSPEAANSIAGDMVGRLAEQAGPGSTTIRFTPDGSPFGQALEAALKNWGYAVITDQKSDEANILALAYTVDEFEGAVLVRLSTARFDLTRMYKPGTDGATPVSPLSILQHGSAGAA